MRTQSLGFGLSYPRDEKPGMGSCELEIPRSFKVLGTRQTRFPCDLEHRYRSRVRCSDAKGQNVRVFDSSLRTSYLKITIFPCQGKCTWATVVWACWKT